MSRLSQIEKYRALSLLLNKMPQKDVATIFQCHRNTIGILWKRRHELLIEAKMGGYLEKWRANRAGIEVLFFPILEPTVPVSLTLLHSADDAWLNIMLLGNVLL